MNQMDDKGRVALICAALSTLLSACGGGGSEGGGASPPPAPITTYAIGGTITGLTGTGLVLQNNLANDLATNANGAFQFSARLTSGAAYAVTVKTQPTNPSQTCATKSANGTVASAAIGNIEITCTTNTFAVMGTVEGLAGTGLLLQNTAANGLANDLAIAANGGFTFSARVASGEPYAVTVKTQPSGLSQTCVPSNGTGTVGSADVTNVRIVCATNTFPVSVVVSGLAGSGLVLLNNGGDNLAVDANGAITFASRVADGEAYRISVLTPPSQEDQVCSIVGGTGIVAGASVTTPAVTCVTSYARRAYSANFNDNTISLYEVNPSSGALRPRGYQKVGDGPVSVGTAASGRFVYVANQLSGDVSAFVANPATGELTQMPGSPFQAGTVPNSLRVHPGERFLYVANFGSNDITVFAIDQTTGALRQVPGSPFVTARTPTSLAFDATGSLLFAPNLIGATVSAFRVDLTTGALTPAPGSPFKGPADSYFAQVSGNSRQLYLAGLDGEIWTYLIDGTSAALHEFAAARVTAGPDIVSLSLDPSGRFLYAPSSTSGKIFAYTFVQGSGLLQAMQGSPFTIESKFGPMTTDPSGKSAYLAYYDRATLQVLNINRTTGALTEAGRVGSGAFPAEIHVTSADAPLLRRAKFAYVTNNTDDTVSMYALNSQSGVLSAIAAPVAAAPKPAAVRVGIDGRFVYVSSFTDVTISTYPVDQRTGALQSPLAPVDACGTVPAGFSPFSIAVDPTRRFLYVSCSGSNKLGSFTIDSATGRLTAIGTSLVATGGSPGDVAVDPTGRFVYVANRTAASVSAYRIDEISGVLTPLAGSPFAVRSGGEATALAVDPSGRFVLVGNGATATVSMLSMHPLTGALTPVGAPVATGASNPISVAFDPDGRRAYVAHLNSSNVAAFALDNKTGVLTPIANSPFATGALPRTVAVDPAGAFAFTVNEGAKNVAAFAVDPVTGALRKLDATVTTGERPFALALADIAE